MSKADHLREYREAVKRGERTKTCIKAVSHTVRTADGGRRTFARWGRKLAMTAFCTSCLGWEADPATCTAPLCELYPYRARTRATARGEPGTVPVRKGEK